MVLSPQWAQSVVVRSECGTIVQPQQSQQPSTSAHAYAASGRPIIVRPRDVHNFANAPINGSDEKTIGSSFMPSFIIPGDLSVTYWIPDAKRNEVGLLEALYRRTAANRTHMLLHSRPLLELQHNFSTCTGDNIDLSHDAFRLSKASMALLQMERNLHDGDNVVLHHMSPTLAGGTGPAASTTVSGKTFKDQLRSGLRAVQEEDYYLVRYRDYSAWAVDHYRTLAKKDHFWGRKYVEQCFAVHVGKEPGELVPITEAQFLFGVELMQRQLLGLVGMGPVGDISYCALNGDQFRSLGALLGDGLRAVGVDGEEARRAELEAEAKAEAAAARAAAGYVPPSPWDWTPGAIRRRLDHQCQRLGRFVLRTALMGLGAYIVWVYLRPALYSAAGQVEKGRQQPNAQRRARRAAQFDADESGGYLQRGFLRSVLLGPKEVFDYLLAPAE